MTRLSSVLLALALAIPLSAPAQNWPTKPVKIIVTSGPGAPPDVMMRGLADRLQQQTGQPFIVENRPGANTRIGMQACAAAEADGHTFCFTTNDSVSINPHLFSKLPYDPDKSFEPVAILAWPHSVIVVGAQVGAKTFDDVVKMSKAKPNTFNWGSFGVGSSSHLYVEWIGARTGWSVTHVPYNSGRSVSAALAGEVELTYLSIGALKPHIDSGKLVPIAVAGVERSKFLPDVPTFAEVGLGNFFVRTWFGLFAPAGTPSAAVAQMNKLSVAVVNDPAFRAKTMDVLTLAPGHETPAEMRAFLKKDREAGGELVRLANVKLD